MSPTRVLPGARLAAGVAIVLALAGCTTSSSASSCSGGQCRVELHGVGADVDVGVEEVELELVAVADGQAELTVDGAPVRLGQGQSASVGGYTITCTAIVGEDVSLTLV